jgi:hypothetical protein
MVLGLFTEPKGPRLPGQNPAQIEKPKGFNCGWIPDKECRDDKVENNPVDHSAEACGCLLPISEWLTYSAMRSILPTSLLQKKESCHGNISFA